MRKAACVLGTILLALSLLAFSGCENSYRKDIVGEWEAVKSPIPNCQNYLEFTSDGGFVSTLVAGERESRREGTYKIDGRKLYLKYAAKTVPTKIYEIDSLTRRELVLSLFGKEIKYRR